MAESFRRIQVRHQIREAQEFLRHVAEFDLCDGGTYVKLWQLGLLEPFFPGFFPTQEQMAQGASLQPSEVSNLRKSRLSSKSDAHRKMALYLERWVNDNKPSKLKELILSRDIPPYVVRKYSTENADTYTAGRTLNIGDEVTA